MTRAKKDLSDYSPDVAKLAKMDEAEHQKLLAYAIKDMFHEAKAEVVDTELKSKLWRTVLSLRAELQSLDKHVGKAKVAEFKKIHKDLKALEAKINGARVSRGRVPTGRKGPAPVH